MWTKLLGSKWLFVAGGVLALSLATMTHAYLGKRDELAEARAEIRDWQASNQELQEALQRQRHLTELAEQARVDLAHEVEDLRVQEVEIVTRIREVWRDRDIVTEVQADCAAEPLPRRVVGLLCDASGATGGVCALPAPAGGPADELPDPGAAG